MTLRSELQDAAVSAAKAYGHTAVEPRHVVFAAARRFRAYDGVGPHFAAAKQALEPHGQSHSAPALTDAATELLATIRTEIDAIAIVVNAFSPKVDGGGHTGADTAKQTVVEQKTADANASAGATAKAPEKTSDILAELDALVGLAAVKAQVRNVIAVVEANAKREKAGLKPVSPGLHLVFTGPPGTGKTTVARLVARLYAATGALPGSGFNEASRPDLIAGYVGQTAIKTQELIAKTRPGVLFIDEAYALSPKVDADFGHEAIATLVKAMEDHRADLAVIVAGYEDEMSEFVASNPGLRSRFKTYIDFPDYSASELTEIFSRMARDAGIELAPGALERADRVFSVSVEKKHFGNARFARSLFEQAYARMAVRAADDGEVLVDELTTLQPDDIEIDVDNLIRETRRIGFN